MEINQIYNEDCLEFLSKIDDKSIDLILTDPPYEHEIHGGLVKDNYFERKLTRDRHINFISNGFDYDKVFSEFDRICKIPNMIIFCSNRQISKIMSYWENKGYSVTLLIWKKPNPIPLGNGNYISDVEFMVYVRGKGATYNSIGVKDQLKVYEYPSPSSSQRIHPTEKPLDLLRRLLLIHSNENDLILDSFSGSGSTSLACLKEKRNFLACEIDEIFFKSSTKRLNNKKSQKTLF
jgi:DNA modification methylase